MATRIIGQAAEQAIALLFVERPRLPAEGIQPDAMAAQTRGMAFGFGQQQAANAAATDLLRQPQIGDEQPLVIGDRLQAAQQPAARRPGLDEKTRNGQVADHAAVEGPQSTPHDLKVLAGRIPLDGD